MVPRGFQDIVEEKIEQEAENGYVMHSALPSTFRMSIHAKTSGYHTTRGRKPRY